MNQQPLTYKHPPRMLCPRLRFALVLAAVLLLLLALVVLPTIVNADDPANTATVDIAPAITATPTPTTNTIAGTVRDHKGLPVANVIVNYTVSSVVSAGSPDNIAQSEPAPDLLQEVVRDEESSGQPADLAVTNSDPQATAATVFTDAQGRYTIAVSANTYRITVSRFGYFAPPPQTVTVPPSRTNVDFTFLTPHTVAGYVRDDAGNPVVNADVTYFTSLSDFGSVETDASGHYSLTVGAGTHRIRVTKAGYLKLAEQPVTVPPDRSDVDFTLTRCATGTNAASAPCYHWVGTSDVGRSTVLDVLADGTTWTNFTLSTRATAGPCSLTITTTVLSSGNILDSKFGSNGGTFAFSGQFSTPNSASGTYQYNNFIPNCGFLIKSGTWTASGTLPAPIITRQPLSQTIPQGTAATVSVAAIGSPPLRYQWYQGQRGDTSAPLAGASTPTYTHFSLLNSTSLWVRIISAQGLSTDSAAVLLTVIAQPTPTDTPTFTPTSTPTACPTDSVPIPNSCATITPTPTGTPSVISSPTLTVTTPVTVTTTPEPQKNYLANISYDWPQFPRMPVLNPITNDDGDGSFVVTWNAARHATRYTLQEDDTPSFASPTTVYTGAALSWSTLGKTTGTYYYRVQADNTLGASEWSSDQAAKVGPPSIIYASADADVIEGRPTVNFGNTDDMWVGYDMDSCHPGTPALKVARSLVQFDLSAIPAGTTITQATLHLHVVNACWRGDGTRPVTAYRSKAAWAEKAVTWKTKPERAEAYGSTAIRMDDSVLDWYILDVTALVRGWLSGKWPNDGLILFGPESSQGDVTRIGFATREWPQYQPYLYITYANVAAASPFSAPVAATLPTSCQTIPDGITYCSVADNVQGTLEAATMSQPEE